MPPFTHYMEPFQYSSQVQFCTKHKSLEKENREHRDANVLSYNAGRGRREYLRPHEYVMSGAYFKIG